MFFRLGYLNTTRNLARSLLAIVSMAVAAAILTSTLTISRGYPREAYRPYRQLIGGEIVAYPLKFSGELPSGERASNWSFNRLETSALSDLPVFHPELFSSGFLTEGQASLQPFTLTDTEALAQQAGVKAVYPYYLLPAQTVVGVGEGVRYQSPIRGRDSALDDTAGSLAKTVVAGRYFTPQDDGQLVAVVSSKQQLPKGINSPTVGSTVVVELPSITMQQGQPIFNYEQPVTKELKVIGQMELPTRLLTWSNGQATESEQLYWNTPEIQIPLATWQALYREAGGQDYHPYEMAIQVPDLTYLEDISFSLNKAFPQYTFVSVAKQVELATRRGLIEPILRAPMDNKPEPPAQNGLPLDLRQALLVLVYLNAALIVAANMLTAVNERKQEMGVLKAVGARRVDIMVMALTEGMLLSALGGSAGFLIIRLAGAFTQLTNHQSLWYVLKTIVYDYGLVLGATISVSLLFGLIPATKLSRLTAMEVLRND